MNLDNNPQSIFDLDERETSVNSKPSSRPGLDILGKLSHYCLPQFCRIYLLSDQ